MSVVRIGRRPESPKVRSVASPLGVIALGAVDEGLTHLQFEGSPKFPEPSTRAQCSDAERWLDSAETALARYFDGQDDAFADVPLLLSGTPFQTQVWRWLLRIPYGETRSYRQVATGIGQPRACRAVGLANGRNPLAIIVPCHRVIGSSGGLTGYGGGLERKSWLLQHEVGSSPPATGVQTGPRRH